jgi:D-alanyl-D-alanine carboxypeptidase
MVRRDPVRSLSNAAVRALVVVALLGPSGCGGSAIAPSGTSPHESLDVLPTAGLATPTAAAALGTPTAQPTLEGALLELVGGRDISAVALVQSPERTWRGASGTAADGAPTDPGDLFEIASTTKTFVATVVLQLVGEGRLALDDSVERRLPGRVRDGDRITIRQLMNHTSGIGMGFDLLPIDRQGALQMQPGTEHHYSNVNYIILGLIVERLTGHPLDAVVLDRIFRPLGLKDSLYGSASLRTNRDGLPPWLGAGRAIWGGRVAGSGGIVSTAADLARFFRALLAGDLLKERELSEMQRTVDTSTDPLAGQSAAPARAGLGIFEIKLPCGSTWGHGGDTGGYSNQVLASPDGTKVVVVAQNTQGWPAANRTAAEMYCL